MGVRPPPYPPPLTHCVGASVAACSGAPSTRRRNSRSRPHASVARLRTTPRDCSSASAIIGVIGKLAASMGVGGIRGSAAVSTASRSTSPRRRRRSLLASSVHAPVASASSVSARLCARCAMSAGASKAAGLVLPRMATTAAATLRCMSPPTATVAIASARTTRATGHCSPLATADPRALNELPGGDCSGWLSVPTPAPPVRTTATPSKPPHASSSPLSPSDWQPEGPTTWWIGCVQSDHA